MSKLTRGYRRLIVSWNKLSLSCLVTYITPLQLKPKFEGFHTTKSRGGNDKLGGSSRRDIPDRGMDTQG